MVEALGALVALILLVGSIIAVVVVTRSKRVETALGVMGDSVDTISTANRELREMIEQRAIQYAANRLVDQKACDEALAIERAARQAEGLLCATQIATLLGKVEVLTGDVGDMIANAVLRTIAQTSGSVTESSTLSTTTTTTTANKEHE